MRKKRFLSIAVSILFILQIFMSFIPLTKVDAENTPIHFASRNTSTYQSADYQGVKTDGEKTLLSVNTPPEKMGTVNEAENTTSESPKNSTETNSEIKTQQETIPQEDSKQNNNEISDSSESQSQNKADTESATPTVVNFPFLTEADLTDSSGKNVGDETDVDKSLDVILNYAFLIPEGQTVSPGTSYSIQLTDQIKIKAEEACTFVKNSEGTVIASITADSSSNLITIKFDNEVKGAVSANFSISCELNKDKSGDSNPVSIDTGKGSISVNFKQEDTNPETVEKQQKEKTEQKKTVSKTTVTNKATLLMDEGPKDISNSFLFITGVQLTKDNNDTALGDDVEKDSEVYIKYTWAIPNTEDVNEGDYYTMQLPQEIHIAAEIKQEIDDDNGNKIADMTISTAGVVKLTFTDYPLTHSNVNGYFYVDCHFDKTQIANSNPVAITFTVPGIAVSPISVNFKQLTDASITKSGSYDKSTDTITWTITANKENIQAKGALITDTIQNDGQVFVPGSITINGTSISDDSSYYNDTDKKLTFNLVNITSQQTITYKTSVASFLASKLQGTYTFNNSADFSYNDYTDASHNLSAVATAVSAAVTYISKTGNYDSVNKKIDWTITVNEDNKSINGASVADIIPTGLTVDTSSISVVDTSNDPLAGFSPPSDTSGNITFHLGNINKEWIINYSTSVDTGVYNSNTSETYTNNAVFTGNGTTLGTTGVGVGINPNIIKKEGIGYDASTGIITWKITVNSHQTTISQGAVVTDTIPEGQTYVYGSAVLDSGTDAIGTYTQNSPDDATQGGTFVYTFTNGFSDTHTITLKTQITDATHYRANYTGIYSNSVNLTAAGINQTTTGSQPVNSEIISKTAKGYDYVTRETTWQILVNKNKMPITNTVVTDTIPEGQQYVADSASIDDGSNGSFTTGDNQVVYTFSSTINKSYTITLKTKLTDLTIFNTNGNKTISNSVSITGTEIPSSCDNDTSASQTIKNTVISKEADYTAGNSYINWTVKTNSNSSIALPGATITDTLQNGLSLDMSSIALYKMDLDSQGNLTPENTPVAINSSNISYDSGTKTFVFTFPNGFSGPFMLNFITDIDTSVITSSTTVNNSVQFSGTSISQTGNSNVSGVWVSNGGAGGTGQTGSITVIKVSDDGITPLSGTVFQLLDWMGNVINTSSSTGNDGKALFDKLKYNVNYTIHEITAPNGYTVGSDYTFKLKKTDGQKNITYNFQDTRKTGDVSFTKTGEDSDASGLQGAVFTLCKSDGTPTTTTATSNATGLVTFTSVPYGYKIKETTAPTGYTLSSQILTAGVNSNGTIVLDNSSIADTKIRNSVTFTKEDNSGNPLQEAEFTLYKDDGTTIVGTALSGSDGKVTFDNVAYGYKIKESRPPSEYYSSSNILTAKMNDTNDGVILDETEFKNTKIVYTQGIVSLMKTDENGNPLKGAEFTLFDSTGSPVQTITTGNDGVAEFNNVQFGNYTVKETKAPLGYSISTSILSVNVNESKTYDLGTISDKSTLGTIEISKSDFSTQEPVAGATITIYKDTALTDVVSSKVTDTNGKAVFGSLSYGHYYFKETNAPEGYKLNEDVHQFDITGDNSSVKDSITDEKMADNTKISIDLTANPASIVGDGKSTSTLTAKVVDSEGKPISGVKVDFSAPSGSFPNGSSAVTDENGEASVIYASDKITDTEPKIIPVTASVNDPEHDLNASDEINIIFEPSNIQGRVWDNETGKPIGGAKVVVKNDSIGFEVTVTTSDDGKYKVAVPEGDLTYDVLITVPVVIDGKEVDKTFIQHSNAGTITGNVEDVFDSEKTATGIVLIKNPDRNTSNYFDDYSRLSIEGIKNGTEFSTPIGSDGDSRGIFHIEDLEQGKDYIFNVVYDLGNGEKIIVGTIQVKTSDGDMKITTTLIDPYGIVTDSSTGKPIEDVDLKLYYADTERNRDSGKTPGTLVQLPALNDFPPENNANPQSSDKYGNYAYMVFPNTDYYIVATKSGYNTVTTGTISVEDAIVKHDISMNPTNVPGTGTGSGGGSTNIKGTIVMKKTDESGNSLRGAVFTLYNTNGNEVQNSTTDSSGVAEFTKIQPGKYTVKETKAPKGYTLSTQTIPVEVNMSKVYDIGTVEDTKESEIIPGSSEPKPEETPEQQKPTPEQKPVNNNTKPDNSEPEQPVKDSVNNTDTSVNQSSKSGGDTKQTDTSKASSLLPKTGSLIDTKILILLGTILIFAGCLLLLSIRRKVK